MVADIKNKIARLQARGMLELAREEFGPAGRQREVRGHDYHFSLHTPVWAYCLPQHAFPYDPQCHNRPLFEIYDHPVHYQEIPQTDYLVFAGAGLHHAFQEIIRLPKPLKLFFEPNLAYFLDFLSRVEVDEVIKQNVFFIAGDLRKLARPLAEILGPDINQLGFPLFWLQDGIEENHADYLAAMREQVEFLYYRHRIYPVAGQENQKGLPLRNLKRELFFDQQKHFYENLIEYQSGGNLEQLRGLLPGRTAILVGAGPDLDRRIDYLRRNQDRAVLISVNTALHTLVKHGIAPHFVIITDTSVGSEKSLAGLPPLPDTILAAHCLAWPGESSFGGKFFFGNWLPQVFGSRPLLPLYGSVITAAFSLAEFLGCSTCVLVGVQLASTNPWGFSYSEDCIHGGKEGQLAKELINRYPQLYPSRAASGKQMFSTLNMKDASLWFLDYIKKSNIKVVNTSYDSLIYADYISIEENYQVEFKPDIGQIIKKIKLLSHNNEKHKVIDFIINEIDFWKNVKSECSSLGGNLSSIERCREFIKFYDNNNCTYLLQRYDGFDYKKFSELFYDPGGDAKIREGAGYYLGNLAKMAGYFAEILLSQLKKIPVRA